MSLNRVLEQVVSVLISAHRATRVASGGMRCYRQFGIVLRARSSVVLGAATLSFLVLGVALTFGPDEAWAFIGAFSDQLMISPKDPSQPGQTIQAGEVPPGADPRQIRNPETILSVGAFDRLVILTEGAPQIISNNGLFTVKNVSDAVFVINGLVGFSSAPEAELVGPPPSITFGFDPRIPPSFVLQETGREVLLTDQLFPNDPNAPTVLFMSDPDPVPPPASPPKNQGTSGGSALNYNAALQTLSFTGHHLIDTGFAGDPILNANVNIPQFVLDGSFSDGNFLFESDVSAVFDISQGSNVFMRAHLQYLEYFTQQNSFVGELTDFTFSSFGSPWIATMVSLFDPTSALFDPNGKLYFTYSPRENLVDLTQSFLSDGVSGGSDAIFSARESVPGPSSLLLLGSGVAGVAGVVWRRHHRK